MGEREKERGEKEDDIFYRVSLKFKYKITNDVKEQDKGNC